MRAVHGNGEKERSRNRGLRSSQPAAPLPEAASHSVQFYEDEASLIEKLSEFIGAALGSGRSCVIIVTQEHRRALAERLLHWGVDLEQTTRTGRFVMLDATECLNRFMVEGWPNRERFFRLIEPELVRARENSLRKSSSIAAFGEMVALLWERGHYDAAIQLEGLWNEMAERHTIDLLCAYPLACFARESQVDLFSQVCREHTNVIPTESYTRLGSDADRLRMVSSLQQKVAEVGKIVEERELAIAQRDRAEDKLWHSEEFAKKIVDGGVDCVKVLDLAGNVEYISPSGLTSLEISDPKSALGRSWLDFWKEEDWPQVRHALDAARAGGVGTFQGDCITATGIRRFWDVRVAPANGRDGRVERLIAVSRDLTQLHQAQQIALQAEKLAAAGRMAATIAHEINNPLEAVTNFIYLARTTHGIPEEAARHLEIADRELTRVAQIAQKTLGFYRDTSKSKWVGVGELIDDVITIYDRKMRYKHLESRIFVDPGLRLYAKPGEIKQALSNLLANAIYASNDGGIIWVRAHASSNWSNGIEPGIRFTIADNGSGMPAEVQKSIFVPFFTTKANLGTGIGLWVTRALIQQQGGYMRFRSSQGQHSGTIMSFFVPVAAHRQADEMAA